MDLGQPVPQGRSGRLWSARSGGKYYWKTAEKTAETMSTRLAQHRRSYRQDEGWLLPLMKARSDDMAKVGGSGARGRDRECLIGHPAVLEVAVVGSCRR